MSTARRLIFGPNPRRTTIRIAVLGAAAFIVFTWVLLPVRTHGISMQPTFDSGRIRLVNRLAYRWRAPARGDIVALRLAGEYVVYIKRIVGLPRERLAIKNGVVHINDVPLEEPYVRFRAPWNRHEVEIGPHHYFVIGDNRGMSAGDHEFGQVNASRIVGEILF